MAFIPADAAAISALRFAMENDPVFPMDVDRIAFIFIMADRVLALVSAAKPIELVYGPSRRNALAAAALFLGDGLFPGFSPPSPPGDCSPASRSFMAEHRGGIAASILEAFTGPTS